MIQQHKFKVGDVGKTRGGQPYRVIATDIGGCYPIAAVIDNKDVIQYYANGNAWTNSPVAQDLLPPAIILPPRFINIYYEDSKYRFGNSAFIEKANARNNGRKHTLHFTVELNGEVENGEIKLTTKLHTRE